jgi:hypothetical protein
MEKTKYLMWQNGPTLELPAAYHWDAATQEVVKNDLSWRGDLQAFWRHQHAGDVAERIPQEGTAEEAQPGERGVGEIAGAVEPLDIIDRHLKEVRLAQEHACSFKEFLRINQLRGAEAALVKLRNELSATVSQRSDLSNAPAVATALSDPAS